jgi:hypothetical protein
MDEYIIDLINDGDRQLLKTYASNVSEAFDLMIQLEQISKIFSIRRVKDDKTWEIENKNLKYLRELRNKIDDENILQEMIGKL